jgi:N-acetylglucosamine-6-phosphate deacetylase
MHWDHAPENPARLAKAGVPIAFTSSGLRDAAKFLDGVRTAVRRGLPADDALRGLTITPAKLFGLETRCGTLEAGKAAHVIVADGNLFDKKTKITETWVDGQRYEISSRPPNDLRGTWEVSFLSAEGKADQLLIKLAGEPEKLSGKAVRGEKEAKLTAATLSDAQFTASFKGDALGWEGVVQLSAVVALDEKSGDTWLGTIAWPDGNTSPASGKRTSTEIESSAKEPSAKEVLKESAKIGDSAEKPAAEKPGTEKPADPMSGEQRPPDAKPSDVKLTEDKTTQDTPARTPRTTKIDDTPRPALFPVNYPFGPFGREAEFPPQPKSVLFKNATVWSCGPQGILEGASVLVEAGKITAVGKDVRPPADCIEVDCQGRHITPGIIDCHSHIATDGGVNESGQTITAEVRIGDFVNPNDIDIYRQLAGGVTAANILHGSANTIGGQNQVIKFRWGAGPDQMKFAGATPGIKFALGENVKQSNWGESFNSRYPQTRMGVEQLVLDAFRAARHYQQTWARYRQDKAGLPPRVDLELEALAEVLEGKRLIHCHSYRQDEILAFLRTCAAFNVRVATLQHVLEGYKLADLMAAQGVGGSTFSDWWAYKFEVYDAIPYNGALMHNAGVNVSFNSDNAALARRLNTEAAKAVKYGGVPEAEALKFVTLNPAKQLRIDQHVGSLETGKDADLAIWNGSPLSTYTLCEQTWIDGRKYFDRQEDLAMRAEEVKRKAALVQRVLASAESEGAASSDARRDSGE